MKLNFRIVIGWALLAGGIGLAVWYFTHRTDDGWQFSGERLTPVERRSVLLITMDTTRADHLQPYGSKTVKTPYLQEFSERSMLFERAYAVTPITLPSHTTILSGRIPPETGVRNNGIHYVPEDIETLASVLGDEDYRTAAFVSASVLDSRYGLDRGFELYDDDLSAGLMRHERLVPDRPAAATVASAMEWLDTLDAGEEFFLWVHLYDPHAAYNPPPPFRDEYRDNLYAGEIAYMDAQIGTLLAHPAIGAEDGPIVSIIGDHGESLGEHGEQTHGILVYDSTMWVPWMLRIPGGPEGVRLQLSVSQVDLAPTILGALGVKSPREVDGLDLMAAMGDEVTGAEVLARRSIYGECYLPYYTYGWAKLNTVRVNHNKLIAAPEIELYDTRRDPRETSNQVETGGNVVHDLELRLQQLLEGENEAEEAAQLEIDSSTQEQLRALGYLAVGSGPVAVEGERANPRDMIHLHVGLEHARQFMGFNLYDEAIAELQSVLDDDPNNLAALVDLSSCLRNKGQMEEARESVLRALEVDPEYSRLHLMLAQIELALGNRDQARELVEGVRERDPRNNDGIVMMGSLLVVEGRRDEARELLQKAIDRDPENPNMQAFFAKLVEIPEGQLESAEKRLVAALERDPFMADAWLMLGKIQKRQGRIDEAEHSFEEGLMRSSDDAKLHRELGLLLADRGDATRAQVHLEEAIRLETEFVYETHVALGALLASQGRFDEARAHYDLVLEQQPTNTAARNNRAIVLIRFGRIDEARQDLEQLVEEHPMYADAHNNLAMVASLQGRWAEAETHSRLATELSPTSADAWNNLGYSLNHLDRPAEAEEAFRTSLEAKPDHWRARLNLGRVLVRLERPEEAAEELALLAASEPSMGEVHLDLGDLYAGVLDQPKRARTHYQVFLRVAPRHPRAEEIRQRITTLG